MDQPNHRITIDSSTRRNLIDWRELVAYKDLFYFLVRRNVTVVYKQTIMGFSWAIIRPFFSMIVFSVIFGRLAKIPSDGVPYPIFSYVALVPWMYFSGVLTASTGSLVANANLLTKVYFPRLIIPVVPVVSKLVDFAVSFLMLGVLMAWFGIAPTANVIFLPVPISHVLYLSTVDVYGSVGEDVLLSEARPSAPSDYYSISKYVGERLLAAGLTRAGVPLGVFRLSGVYGPGDAGKSTLNAIARAAKECGVIRVTGDGGSTRDFVHVDDVCRLAAEAISMRLASTVNVATGCSRTIREWAEMIAEVRGHTQIEYVPEPSDARVRRMMYDTTALIRAFPGFGFRPAREAIAEYLAGVTVDGVDTGILKDVNRGLSDLEDGGNSVAEKRKPDGSL